jgi:tetratricopeptide (TPR) repeat protein
MFASMNANDREEIIRRYLDHVAALESSGSGQTSSLREIARSAGMSDREIAEVERAAQSYYENGWARRRAERWDQAIEFLTIATMLDPSNVKSLFELASAYAGRWQANGDEGDRLEAERLIARCNDLSPMHEPSMRLLKSLEETRRSTLSATRPSQPQTPRTPATTGRRRVAVVMALLGMIVAVAGVAIPLLFRGKGKLRHQRSYDEERGIPAVLAPLADHPEVRLLLDESTLDGSATTYHIKGRIVFESDSALASRGKRITVISGLSFRLNAIDSSGTVAYTSPLTTYPCTDLSGSLCFDYTTPYIVGLHSVQVEGRGNATKVEVEAPGDE